MDLPEIGKEKKGLIIKTWERCRSIGGRRSARLGRALFRRSKSWPSSRATYKEKEDHKRGRKRQVAPEGCFTVYVGQQKQRFVIKTECANHPLFKMLLEEAELEYGYNSDGPLTLPCDVDLFRKVLAEMECDEVNRGGGGGGCGFVARSYSSYHLLSHSKFAAINN